MGKFQLDAKIRENIEAATKEAVAELAAEGKTPTIEEKMHVSGFAGVLVAHVKHMVAEHSKNNAGTEATVRAYADKIIKSIQEHTAPYTLTTDETRELNGEDGKDAETKRAETMAKFQAEAKKYRKDGEPFTAAMARFREAEPARYEELIASYQ